MVVVRVLMLGKVFLNRLLITARRRQLRPAQSAPERAPPENKFMLVSKNLVSKRGTLRVGSLLTAWGAWWEEEEAPAPFPLYAPLCSFPVHG